MQVSVFRRQRTEDRSQMTCQNTQHTREIKSVFFMPVLVHRCFFKDEGRGRRRRQIICRLSSVICHLSSVICRLTPG